MRLASFAHGGGTSFGIVSDGGLIDIRRRDPALVDLAHLIAADGWQERAAAWEREPPDHRVDEVTFLPVIPRPDKLICVGLNYRQHTAELGAEIPQHPSLFVRFFDSVVGHRQPLVAPAVSHRFDYEAELAVIIGQAGRHVPRDRALEHIAGYTCFNDGSIRDWQVHTAQYTPGKNFMHTGALGPWMVTRDEIADPGDLRIRSRLNGMHVQDALTSDMVFGVPELIEYITAFTELHAGDVIATGTPSGVGVGRKPRLYMKAGDSIEIEIEKIGILSNPVVAEDPSQRIDG